MTAEDLGLPEKFKNAMKGMLGQSGVIVEIDGKYYLSDDRLRELKDRFTSGIERW